MAERVQQERGKIAADEAKKAKLALSNDLDQKTKEVADLQEILKQKDEKLTEAQKAQADLLKKQRELDDAKRELDLTIEKRIAGRSDRHPPAGAEGSRGRIEAQSFRKGTDHFFDAEAD